MVIAPRLTVLIAAWDAASSIETALASVLEEREIALECVVIDDGSTDGTAEVVQAVADRDPRVVLIRRPSNEGVSIARNHGLQAARGEWLAFLDADDRLLPGGVAALMGPTSDPEVLAVIGQRIWTDGVRTWLSPLYDIPDIREPGRKSIASHPGLLYYASATGKAIHRSLTTDLLFEGRILGDQPWTIRALIRAGDHIQVIGETVYEWRRPHPDRYVATITAESRASAERAAEMATVARTAFNAVCDEADARAEGEADRLTIKRAYFERLLRSDIGIPVRTAADRHDPGTEQLYRAVGQFLEMAPLAILTSTDAHLLQVVRPVGYRFSALPPRTRASYWAMIRPVLRMDPRSSRALGGNVVLGLSFWLARAIRAPLGEAIASVVLIPASLAARLIRRVGLA